MSLNDIHHHHQHHRLNVRFSLLTVLGLDGSHECIPSIGHDPAPSLASNPVISLGIEPEVVVEEDMFLIHSFQSMFLQPHSLTDVNLPRSREVSISGLLQLAGAAVRKL